MRIEILTIGNEILSGVTLNTNFQVIARKISSLGVTVAKHVVCSDEPSELSNALKDMKNRADIVITTGGLGPTLDDRTKHIISDFFDSPMITDETIKNDLIKRYGKQLETIESQSLVPQKAILLKNCIGTAPGFYFQNEDFNLLALPGVPIEMQDMLEKQALPILTKLLAKCDTKKIKRLSFWNLSENIISPIVERLHKKYPQIEFGIYPGFGYLRLEMKANSKHSHELDACNKEAKQEFVSRIYSDNNSSLEEVLQRILIETGKTLSLAESLTGGHIASKLTNIPGASNYFLGSIISYSNKVKAKALQVKETDLSEKGAVSEAVAIQMAEGALRLCGSDYALAVTGIAGPDGGSETKPVGTVWCALAQKKSTTFSWKILAKGRGKRSSVIEYTANYVLGALWRYLSYNITPIEDDRK